jgi:hypothetical protein
MGARSPLDSNGYGGEACLFSIQRDLNEVSVVAQFRIFCDTPESGSDQDHRACHQCLSRLDFQSLSGARETRWEYRSRARHLIRKTNRHNLKPLLCLEDNHIKSRKVVRNHSIS